MNLRNEILKEHSKSQCNKIVEWVGDKQPRFDELFNLFLNDEYRVVQRAAWPVSYCVIAHPHLISKHWGELIANLEKPGLHDAVKRNSIRLMEDIDIPEAYQGAVMDICFRFIESPTSSIAVKAFSLTVLHQLSKLYPDILPELKLLIEDQLPYQTAAFKVRAKRILADKRLR